MQTLTIQLCGVETICQSCVHDNERDFSQMFSFHRPALRALTFASTLTQAKPYKALQLFFKLSKESYGFLILVCFDVLLFSFSKLPINT